MVEVVKEVTPEVLDFLSHTDACTLSNAIEEFNVRTRDSGFMKGQTHCLFPNLPAVAGYAATAHIRTNDIPIANFCSYHRIDWWRYVESVPKPRVLVLYDADPQPGNGAFLGEIHAAIASALDCVACITNGAVRDVRALESAQFQCFAATTRVSHSYAHIIRFGEPVEIGGLGIVSGDLMHGDCHGVQKVPVEIAHRLPAQVERMMHCETDLLRYVRSADFSLDGLDAMLKHGRRDPKPVGRFWVK